MVIDKDNNNNNISSELFYEIFWEKAITNKILTGCDTWAE